MKRPASETVEEKPPPMLQVAEHPYETLKQENSRILHEDIRNRAVDYRGLPEIITLNHTDICNLKCIMCPRSRKQGRNRLSRRILEYVIAELFPTARKVVLTTSGGEPLAVDFDFLVEQAIQYGVKVDAVTNGVLLTPDVYARARLAFDHLNISCDSHIPEVYEYVRSGAKFERLQGNLTAIRDARRTAPDNVLLSLSAVVIKSNLEHLADFVRFAGEMEADAVIFQQARSYLNPTPRELPENSFSRETILQHIERARDAAREIGMNLFLSEFGLPGVEGKPLRAKVPQTIEDQGLCWFMAQNFGVMYTGEIYPCCCPTDHCLGDVNYQHPVDIWNGPPARRLREALLSGRGTLFCSGCINASHLPPRKPAWLVRPAQRARMFKLHIKNKLNRRLTDWTGRSKLWPRKPKIRIRHDTLEEKGVSCRARPFLHKHELLVRNPWDESLWFVNKGSLFRMETPESPPQLLARLREAPAPLSTCLHHVDPRTVLIGFCEEGALHRVTINEDGAETTEALRLSNPRSYVRGTLTGDDQGVLWVGEYGTFPGARCAHLYRSTDQGKRFEHAAYLQEARHVHAVHLLGGSGRVLVTTGDLAGEQRLYLSRKGGASFRTLLKSWSGFSAIAETERYVHFGSDLLRENGFLRWERGFKTVPEFRPLYDRYDLQIRQIVPLPGNRLAALAAMDRNLLNGTRTACVLLSPDEGATWSVAHRFSRDGDDLPERLLVLSTDPLRLLTVYTDRPFILECSF